jgi:hypothetical protein
MKPGHAILPSSAECREEGERKEKSNHIKTTETRTELKHFSIKCCQMYEKLLLSLKGTRYRSVQCKMKMDSGELE